MATVLVDGRVDLNEKSRRTWGDLLSSIEEVLVSQGRIVSEVRFDGVGQPSFRDAALQLRGLDDVQIVEVESAEPHDVLNRVIDEAIAASEELQQAIGMIAARFRTPDIIAANNGLADFARGVGSVVAVVRAVAETTGADLDRMICGERAVTATIQEMNEQVEALAAFQRAMDWDVVADILQNDIPGPFSELLAILHHLRPTVH